MEDGHALKVCRRLFKQHHVHDSIFTCPEIACIDLNHPLATNSAPYSVIDTSYTPRIYPAYEME